MEIITEFLFHTYEGMYHRWYDNSEKKSKIK
jgi:hypothetical protein